ncbi:MAG: tetratricopeptide repeat protein [Nitrospinae bacterium]|nr:tetratricopeptide repeat protein [Nitrospinota bacterium]
MNNPFHCFLFLLALLAGCATTEARLDKQLQTEKNFFSGMNYLERRLLPQAREEFLAAIQLDPSVPKLHSALGRVYLEENKPDLAEKEFKKTLDLDNQFLDAYIQLGTLYMGQKRFDEAIGSFKKLLSFAPQFPEFRAQNFIGWAYYEKGDYDQAFQSLRTAVISSPKYMPARYNLGLALFALGHEEEAAREFNEAVKLSPGFSPAHNQLGLIYMKNKMYKEALSEFKEVIASSPDENMKRMAGEYVKIIEGMQNSKPQSPNKK